MKNLSSPTRRHLLAACLSSTLLPDVVLAQRPQTSLAADFVAAVNASEAEQARWLKRTLSATGQRRMPLDEAERLLVILQKKSGGLDLVDVETTAKRLLLTVRARNSGKVRMLQLRPDRDEPDNIYSLPDAPLPAPYDRPLISSSASRSELKTAILQRATFAAERDEFSGAISVVAPDGEPLIHAAFGYADREAGDKNTPDHRFNIGSADKSFTAILIGRLIERGKLGFETRVIDILPEYMNQDAARQITVAHLLAHQSGLGDLWSRPGYSQNIAYKRVADIVPAFWDAQPSFTPGTRAAYSNEGFVLLGAIVEQVTGRNWWDELNDHIYAPAGMAHSRHFLSSEATPLRALGYKLDWGDVLQLGDRKADRFRIAGHSGTSCGGGYATVADMTRYLRALRAGTLLSPTMTDRMSTPYPGGLAEYGMGFQNTVVAGRSIRGHGGGGPFSGVDGKSGIVWETGWSYSVLGNYDAPYGTAVANDIAAMLAAQPA